ncbi:MAG: hypothetical protein K2G63_03785 [Oscillospiraceae bacterium]|nr:hypothetical protein [Oscillospiraceae bacterium]
MKNFISGRVIPDSKGPVAHIKLEDMDLQIGEYICYSPTDMKMIVVEPSNIFRAKMEHLSKVANERRIAAKSCRDEAEAKKLSAEYKKLEAEYRSQMSSSFIFVNKGYDVIDMEVPKNCLTFLDLKNDSITAILYGQTAFFLINPDDEWKYDNDGDVYNKRAFIQILRNAI